MKIQQFDENTRKSVAFRTFGAVSGAKRMFRWSISEVGAGLCQGWHLDRVCWGTIALFAGRLGALIRMYHGPGLRFAPPNCADQCPQAVSVAFCRKVFACPKTGLRGPIYAARAANSLKGETPVWRDWFLRIMFAVSILANVAAADWNALKPSFGRVTRLKNRSAARILPPGGSAWHDRFQRHVRPWFLPSLDRSSRSALRKTQRKELRFWGNGSLGNR